ncbi:hypothetical protein [Neisseria sicca]|nr:hypothetical protein [Neisseria sicca]
MSVEFSQTLPSLKGRLKTGMAGYAETTHTFFRRPFTLALFQHPKFF